MRLLLHLLALIAGITGLVAGPAAARASEPAVVASVLAGGAEQACEPAAVRSAHAETADLRRDSRRGESGPRGITPQSSPVDERRIE